MSTLTITIETQTNTDYDEVSETVKCASGDIDGVKLPEKHTCPSTETDVSCKTEFKTLLTANGHTWTTEA